MFNIEIAGVRNGKNTDPNIQGVLIRNDLNQRVLVFWDAL